MVCVFPNFDVDILKNPIPYKYVIHSPKATKDDECYEHIHTSRGDYNRCLILPHEQRKAQSMYVICVNIM